MSDAPAPADYASDCLQQTRRRLTFYSTFACPARQLCEVTATAASSPFSGRRRTQAFMATLEEQTETALRAVLNLCTVTQDDVDALQRHDDAALASLDIIKEDAAQVQ